MPANKSFIAAGIVASAVDSISSNNDHPIYLKIALESSQIALSDELLPINKKAPMSEQGSKETRVLS
jgi:adenine C2-methylase RlmN of 23S rRNA A2503 and tRNA A37